MDFIYCYRGAHCKTESNLQQMDFCFVLFLNIYHRKWRGLCLCSGRPKKGGGGKVDMPDFNSTITCMCVDLRIF